MRVLSESTSPIGEENGHQDAAQLLVVVLRSSSSSSSGSSSSSSIMALVQMCIEARQLSLIDWEGTCPTNTTSVCACFAWSMTRVGPDVGRPPGPDQREGVHTGASFPRLAACLLSQLGNCESSGLLLLARSITLLDLHTPS